MVTLFDATRCSLAWETFAAAGDCLACRALTRRFRSTLCDVVLLILYKRLVGVRNGSVLVVGTLCCCISLVRVFRRTMDRLAVPEGIDLEAGGIFPVPDWLLEEVECDARMLVFEAILAFLEQYVLLRRTEVSI